MKRARRAAMWLLLCALPIALTGCVSKAWYKKQVRWGYVFDIGTAEDITRWTLNQTEAERIADGHATLEALSTFESGPESGRAVDGYLQVHRKLLEEWPGLKPSPMASGGLRDREHLIYSSRVGARKNAEFHKDSKIAQELWRRVQEIDRGATAIMTR